MRIVLASRSEKDMKQIVHDIKQEGGVAEYVFCDAAKEEDLKNAVDFAVSQDLWRTRSRVF